MAAGMHPARNRGGIGAVGGFRHCQRIHVGAQADGPPARARTKRSDDAGFRQPAMNVEAGFLQQPGNDVAGPDLLKAQLWMGVQVTAQRDEEGHICVSHLYIPRSVLVS